MITEQEVRDLVRLLRDPQERKRIPLALDASRAYGAHRRRAGAVAAQLL